MHRTHPSRIGPLLIAALALLSLACGSTTTIIANTGLGTPTGTTGASGTHTPVTAPTATATHAGSANPTPTPTHPPTPTPTSVPPPPPTYFIWHGSPANSSYDYTTISNGYTDNKPNAIVLATPLYDSNAVYDNHPIGVYYNGNKWGIFNQDLSAIPNQGAFNVQVYAGPGSLSGNGVAFVQHATGANINGDSTVIDNPAINNQANMLLQVTAVWDANHVYVNHPIGVWYYAGKWEIFTQDQTPMPVNAAFNVVAFPPNDTNFFYSATASNKTYDFATMSAAATNSHPNAIVLATPNWNPGTVTGVYDNHNIGVFYTSGRWAVFNQDTSAIPDNVAFNIAVFGG